MPWGLTTRRLTASLCAQAVDGNMVAMDQLRCQVNDLEKIKFVTLDRAARLEGEVEPRRAEVAKLSSDRQVQDEELNRTLHRVESLLQQLKDKESHISCVQGDG